LSRHGRELFDPGWIGKGGRSSWSKLSRMAVVALSGHAHLLVHFEQVSTPVSVSFRDSPAKQVTPAPVPAR